MMIWLVVVEWVHVLAGIVWVGGLAYQSFVVWPALLAQPVPAARKFYGASAAPAARLIGPAGMLVLLAGIARATWLGPIRSLHALFGTRYGWFLCAAIVLVITAGAVSGGVRSKLEQRVWDGDELRPGAAAYLARANVVTVAALAGVVLCMVLMRYAG